MTSCRAATFGKILGRNPRGMNRKGQILFKHSLADHLNYQIKKIESLLIPRPLIASIERI